MPNLSMFSVYRECSILEEFRSCRRLKGNAVLQKKRNLTGFLVVVVTLEASAKEVKKRHPDKIDEKTKKVEVMLQ